MKLSLILPFVAACSLPVGGTGEASDPIEASDAASPVRQESAVDASFSSVRDATSVQPDAVPGADEGGAFLDAGHEAGIIVVDVAAVDWPASIGQDGGLVTYELQWQGTTCDGNAVDSTSTTDASSLFAAICPGGSGTVTTIMGTNQKLALTGCPVGSVSCDLDWWPDAGVAQCSQLGCGPTLIVTVLP